MKRAVFHSILALLFILHSSLWPVFGAHAQGPNPEAPAPEPKVILEPEPEPEEVEPMNLEQEMAKEELAQEELEIIPEAQPPQEIELEPEPMEEVINPQNNLPEQELPEQGGQEIPLNEENLPELNLEEELQDLEPQQDPPQEELMEPAPEPEPEDPVIEPPEPDFPEPEPLTAPELLINEVMLGSEINPEKDDWIELYNPGEEEILLGGWQVRGVTQGGGWIDITSEEQAAIQPKGYYLLSHYTNSSSSALEIKPHSNKSSVDFVDDLISIELKNPEQEIVDHAEFEVELWVDEWDEPLYLSYERMNPQSDGLLPESWGRASTRVNLKEEAISTFATPSDLNSHEVPSDPVQNLTYELIPVDCFSEEFLNVDCSPNETFLAQFTWENPPSAQLITVSQIDEWWEEWWQLETLSGDDEPYFEALLTSGETTAFEFIAYDAWDRPSEAETVWIDFSPQIVINEFFADPLSEDKSNEFVELWNVGLTPIDLSFWELTTNAESADEDELYIFADEGRMFSNDPAYDYILNPGEYFVLFADESLLRLSNQEGIITLFDDEGWVIDEYNYAGYLEGYSQGRSFMDLNFWDYFFHPTPAGDNLDFNTPPVAVFDFQQSSELKMNVTGENSYDAEGDKLTFLWEGDDGFYSEKENPGAFTFPSYGEKTITLTVTDAYGDSTQVVKKYNAQEKQADPSPAPENNPDSNQEDSDAPEQHYPQHQLINEVMVNPEGSDTGSEWVELYNDTFSAIDLTGWYLDDDEGGTGAKLIPEGTVIEPNDFWMMQGPGLSFKNSDDAVRLLDPDKNLIQIINYTEAQEGQTYAKNDQDDFIWTPLVTPGTQNQFPPPPKGYHASDVTFERILPNPEGSDGDKEKLVLKNHLSKSIDLSGWTLRDAKDKQTNLTGFSIKAGASLTLKGDDIGFSLKNSDGFLSLHDGLENEIDSIDWKKAGSGQWLIDPDLFYDGMQVTVVRTIDGDTFELELEDGLRIKSRLLGVDTPESVHPFKPLEYYGQEASDFLKETLTGKTITLTFDQNKFDSYGRLLSYVHLEGDTFVNAEIIKQGYGYAYTRYPFEHLDDFVGYEEEAKAAGLGLWEHEEVREAVKEMMEEEKESWSKEGEMQEQVDEGAFISLEAVEEEIAETAHDLPQEEEEVAENKKSLDEWMECALGELRIEAFVPNPEKGQEEWIRVINAGESEICLEGWQLDDKEGGSKPFELKEETLAPGETRTLYKSETKLNLNNKDDEVRLINPLREEVDSIVYGTTHAGETFTHTGGNWAPKTKVKKSSGSSSSKAKVKTKRHKFDRERIAYQYDWVNEVVTGSFKLGKEGEIQIQTAQGELIAASFQPDTIDWEMVDFLSESQQWKFQLHSDETGHELIALNPLDSWLFPSAFADGEEVNSTRAYGWITLLMILLLATMIVLGKRMRKMDLNS